MLFKKIGLATAIAMLAATSVQATTSIPWGIGTGILTPPPPPGGGVAYVAPDIQAAELSAVIPFDPPGGSTGPTVPEPTDVPTITEAPGFDEMSALRVCLYGDWICVSTEQMVLLDDTQKSHGIFSSSMKEELCDGSEECTSSTSYLPVWEKTTPNWSDNQSLTVPPPPSGGIYGFRYGHMPVLGTGGPTISYVDTVAATVEGAGGGGGTGDPRDPSIKGIISMSDQPRLCDGSDECTNSSSKVAPFYDPHKPYILPKGWVTKEGESYGKSSTCVTMGGCVDPTWPGYWEGSDLANTDYATETMAAAWVGPVIVGTIVRLWPRKAH